jgi:hypothetical protein
MRNKKIQLIAVFIFGIGCSGLLAQSNFNASGGNASGSGGTVSYSVGQIIYTTNSNSNGSVKKIFLLLMYFLFLNILTGNY